MNNHLLQLRDNIIQLLRRNRQLQTELNQMKQRIDNIDIRTSLMQYLDKLVHTPPMKSIHGWTIPTVAYMDEEKSSETEYDAYMALEDFLSKLTPENRDVLTEAQLELSRRSAELNQYQNQLDELNNILSEFLIHLAQFENTLSTIENFL